MASSADQGRLEQMVAEFFAKSVHIILDARIPSLSGRERADMLRDLSDVARSQSISGVRLPDRWFNLELDRLDLGGDHMEPWRTNGAEPLVVDVLLQQPTAGEPPPAGSASRGHVAPSGRDSHQPLPPPRIGSASGLGDSGGGETLLERWIIQYERRTREKSGGAPAVSPSAAPIASWEWEGGRAGAGSGGGDDAAEGPGGGAGAGDRWQSVEVPVVYKQAVVMLRSLYVLARSLPAHRLFKQAKALSQHHRTFRLAYRLSTGLPPPPPPPPASAEPAAVVGAMKTWKFTPVESPTGRMCIQVAYWQAASVTALEIKPPILPRIIADYVGSPTTDPLRRFTTAHTGPWQNPAAQPPSGAPISPKTLHRRHSWGASRTRAFSPHAHVHVEPSSPGPHPPSGSASRSPSLSPSGSHPLPAGAHTRGVPHVAGGPSGSGVAAAAASTAPAPPPPPPLHDPSALPPPSHYLSRSPSSSPSPPHVGGSAPQPPLSRVCSAPVSIPRTLPRGGGGGTGQQQSPAGHPRSASNRDHYPPHPSQRSQRSHMPATTEGFHPPSTPPNTRPSSSPPRWEPSSAPARPGTGYSSHWEGRQVAAGPRPPVTGALSTAIGGLGSSPAPALGATPGRSSALPTTTPAVSSPLPMVGGDTVLALAKLPSYSFAAEGRVAALSPFLETSPLVPGDGRAAAVVAARLSISPLTESAFLMSPTHGSSHLHQAPSGRMSMFRAPSRGPHGSPGGHADEDNELPLPFAVDDEDVTAPPSSLDATIASVPRASASSQRPQGAVVGALIHILKSAPPLTQDPAAATPPSPASPAAVAAAGGGRPPHPHSWPASAPGGGGVGGSGGAEAPPPSLGVAGSLHCSSLSEALSELKGYAEMRESLLRQRGDSTRPRAAGGGGGGGGGGAGSSSSAQSRGGWRDEPRS